jgi:3-oxoacyl-[acyl-carrier-protein] synthase II
VSDICVTGLGVLSSFGNDTRDFLDGLMTARSSVGPVTSVADLEKYRVRVGCEVRGFRLADHGLERWESHDVTTQRALAAIGMALVDAGLDPASDVADAGLALATSLGGAVSREIFYRGLRRGEPPDHDLIRNVPSAVIAGNVARHFGLTGPLTTVVTACAAGTNAIGCGMDQIRLGRAPLVIAGGVDPFSAISFSGFSVLNSLSSTQAAPFTEERSGLTLGEASAFAILEDGAHARARGARIYARALGYGISNDAYHPTSPDPTGGGAIRSMRAALEDARLAPEQIDYINAHGTGTEYNDIMEVRAVREVFGAHAAALAISSTKSQIGHTLGAAGAVEFAATALAIHHGFLPATVNFGRPMCADCDFVPNVARRARLRHALSNSFAFGGNTASIVLGHA